MPAISRRYSGSAIASAIRATWAWPTVWYMNESSSSCVRRRVEVCERDDLVAGRDAFIIAYVESLPPETSATTSIALARRRERDDDDDDDDTRPTRGGVNALEEL